MCDKKAKKFFLCAFCGIQIASNLNNLKQHEKLHQNIINRVKCANCDSTFADKHKYFKHWASAHKDIQIPDKLNIVREPSKYSIKKTFKNPTKNESPPKKTVDVPIELTLPVAVGLKIENVMKHCLIHEPLFGEMKFLH